MERSCYDPQAGEGKVLGGILGPGLSPTRNSPTPTVLLYCWLFFSTASNAFFFRQFLMDTIRLTSADEDWRWDIRLALAEGILFC